MFKDKLVVITGAGGTLCSEIARYLGKEGAKVILVGRTLEKLQKVADTIGKNAYIYPCDVADEAAVNTLADWVQNEVGLCDYLVNGAGGNNAKAMPTVTQYTPVLKEGEKGLHEIDMEAFESVLRINTMGTVYPTLAFSLHMIKKGGGSIINFASMNSYCPLTRCFSYAMSKAAIYNLTQSLSAYFAPANIRVNAIAPGFMVNERSKNYLGTVEDGLTARGQQVISHTPMGRFGQDSDLIGTVKWLLAEQASGFVTGITVPVDGGFLTLGGV